MHLYSSNEKLDKAKEIINDLEADLVAYNEHRINLRHKENQNGLSKMFTGVRQISEVWQHITFMRTWAKSKKKAQLCLLMAQ